VAIYILQQAKGNVTELSNRKLTKQITKPNILLYTSEGRAVWLSLQNTFIVNNTLYPVCPRKTVMAIRDTDFNSTINFLLHSTEPPLCPAAHTNSIQDISVALELRKAISDLQ
jgi:hypothetical protein